MPTWTVEVDLSPLVAKYKDGELAIEELAIKVVAQLRYSGWRGFSPYPHTWDDTVDRLLQVTTPEEYAAAFEYIYDLADQDRVWITTS